MDSTCDICHEPSERAVNHLAMGKECARIFVSFDVRLETIPPGSTPHICAPCLAQIISRAAAELGGT